ncbi:IS982 family transposase [Flavobacterium sp.]|uniref:IS982 family transposase n=1 Tax=Flavobacterium sp. TaxID=239 RepID=UPI002637AB9C|nr:IS982 family transposase [Flavobacterium sp.]
MFSRSKIIEIFVSIDDFCKEFEPALNEKLIGKAKIRNKPSALSMSEVMTIQVAFHHSGFRTFKDFYLGYVCKHLNDMFPKTVSYNRMTELCSASMLHLFAYLKSFGLGDCTGISFVDSTPLRVCDNRRIHQHKTFKGIAQRGQCSLGWFYGFKLHMVCNDIGQLIDVQFTPANVDDRTPLKSSSFISKLWGKLFGDKGYISRALFSDLFGKGIHLITKLKRNMKSTSLTPIMDAIMLRKRAIAETIIDQLKNICQIEHSRHRSPKNFFNNLFAALIAYNFNDKKPSLKMNFVDTKQLYLPL